MEQCFWAWKMLNKYKIFTAILMMSLTIIAAGGCRQKAQQAGIHVMFEEKPLIAGDEVYWHGQTIGSIAGTQVGYSAITKVTVQLYPKFKQQAGHNWAFYVDKGRLMAERLSITGAAVTAGDHVCGFSSKAALKWFKIKTLLKDRVANATRRANSLQRRFGRSQSIV